MKLATKLAVAFLLLSIIPLVVVGYLIFENSRQTIEQSTRDRLISTSVLKENEFARWVKDSQRSLRELARRPSIRDYASVIISHESVDPEYQAARRSIRNDHFLLTIEEEGGFLELFILRDSDGLILVSTDEIQEGKYRESEPYFVEGKSRTYVQNVYYSLTQGKAALTIGTPIKDKDGLPTAVLAGHVDLAEMSKIMVQARGQSATEETYLVNKFNFFVTESRFEPGYALKKGIHTDGVAKCLAHNNGVGSYNNYRGVPVIGAYRWMPELELCILTEMEQAEAFAPIAVLRNTVLWTGIAIAMMVALLGVFFARTITRPVCQLVMGTEEIGRGNLDHRMGAGGKDEIGELSRAIDQMTKNLKAITSSRDELDKEVTERKRVEEALKESHDQLERRVLERTKELAGINVALRTEITERKRAEERLVQSAKLAGLGQLGAGIAHELNQPITTIQGFAQRIKRDGGRQIKDHADELDLIINASHRMARIVDNIRLFSRQSDFKAQPIDPLTPLDDALMLIYEQLRLHGIEVERPAGDVLPRVMGDQVKLQQVFSNLIMNARDALETLPKGRPKRLVLGGRAEGDRVVYSVEDNGPGILEEDQARIFDPFFTTKEVGKGTGLGLSISHGIVADHKGEIRYEPVEGGGARFLVSLPIAPMEETGVIEGYEQGEQKYIG